MYILFEEHQYESHEVETILKDIYVLQDVNKAVSVQYVGYFYNPHLHDCVFILPKVLLDEKEHLVGVRQGTGEPVTPEMVLTPKGQEKLSKEYRKFIYEFSVWIYRSLSVYRKQNKDSKAIYYRQLPQEGKGRLREINTYLDIVLSLIRFNKENQNFCLYHNIKKIEDINLNNYIENGNWCTKIINDMNITWNYENGAILCMETSSCNYETKRGVKVGDLLSNVMDLYGPDSDISSWDTSSNSFISVDNKDNNLFMLFYANDGVSLNAGNIIDEEMMTILFYANEGVITKIEIKSGN